jgi:hypothetical protein
MQMNFDGDVIFVDIEKTWCSEIYFSRGVAPACLPQAGW